MIFGPPAPELPDLETGLQLETERPNARRSCDDEVVWSQYAAAALTALVRTDSSPQHVAERAASLADAMLAEHARRWS